MSFKCTICKKDYKSYQSLWNHNKKFHDNINNQTNDYNNQSNDYTNNETKKLYSCSKCKKEYTHFQNRWRHEKTCNKVNTETLINNGLAAIQQTCNILTKKITNLEKKSTKKYINNGTIVNGQNKMIINKTGTENVLELNDKEVTDIFNKEIEGVIKLIEFVNFNERLPSNHSFCSTALDSPYLSTYNIETNTIDKDRKKYFFDDLFSRAVERQEILYKNNKTKFTSEKRKQIEDNIENLKKIRNYDFNNKIVKEIMKKLNLLSYNKRNIIRNTWFNNNEDEDTDDEYFAKLVEEDIKEIEYVEVYDNGISYLKSINIESSEMDKEPLILKKSKVKEIIV